MRRGPQPAPLGALVGLHPALPAARPLPAAALRSVRPLPTPRPRARTSVRGTV